MNVKKIHTCTGHRAAIYALGRGRDDRHFLTAGGEGWIVEWNLDNPENGKVIANTETQIFSLCVLPDRSRLVAGNMNGGVHWIERDQPEKNQNIQHHTKGVYDILALGENLFTAGGDGVLTRWDIASARTVESFQLSNQALRAIAYSEKRREIAVGSSDGSIYFLDVETLALKYTIPNAHTNSVFTLAWSPDNSLLLSGGRDAWLRVWESDALSGNSPQPSAAGRISEAAHLFTVNHIAYSPDGQLFATASRDKTIKIWDAQSFQLQKVIDTLRYGGHINSVNRLMWMGDECLVSVSDDRGSAIWEIKR